MKVRVLIAEEEENCRSHLRDLLNAEPHVELLAECRDGKEALAAIQNLQPDLVFLDLRLPRLDGFSLIKRLNGSRPVIIVVTADDRFALKAFELEAADYLLKPIRRERFQSALRRGRERLQSNAEQRQSADNPSVATPTEIERLTISSRGRILVIKTAEVDWVCSAGNYVEIHIGSTVHLMRASLGALRNKLPQNSFLRISRTSVVNLDRIKEIRPKTHGDYVVILQDGTLLNGSRNFRVGTPGLLQRPS
ncbi:MAG: LytR/AlgR family response regulator transcription factor [Limisphaerales bacterium]